MRSLTTTFTCDRCGHEKVAEGDVDATPVGWRVLATYSWSLKDGMDCHAHEYKILICDDCHNQLLEWVAG